MLILGIDTSAVVCTAALANEDRVLRSFSIADKRTHSETLLPGILSLLEQEKASVGDLSAIAFSVGPGSFTGLRIGLATVKGLAFANDLPCVPVSTLEALAARYDGVLTDAVLCPLMDARRGEYYQAFFSCKDGVIKRISPDRTLSGETVLSEMKQYEKVVLLGDGAEKFAAAFSGAGVLSPEERRFQDGGAVALLGARLFRQGKALSCRSLTPAYLRLPQAEREWLAKQNENQNKKETEK